MNVVPFTRMCLMGWTIIFWAIPSTARSSQASPDTGDRSLLSDTMEVAQAEIVTVEIEKVRTVTEALQQIERRSVPDDGKGRTYAILDAYGERVPNGKFHISMHVSSEKPGLGSLVLRPSGEVLWKCRINQGTKAPVSPKSLGIFIDDGSGNSLIVDGSRNPHSILDAPVRGMDRNVRDLWPNRAVREVTFTYSACGCPVKVLAKRVGERTVRTKELPIIFPDDPAVIQIIRRLMKW